jgi:hypothetical protein
VCGWQVEEGAHQPAKAGKSGGQEEVGERKRYKRMHEVNQKTLDLD